MLLHFYNLFFATSFSAYGTYIIPLPPKWHFHDYFGVFHLLKEDGLPQGMIYSQNGCLVTDWPGFSSCPQQEHLHTPLLGFCSTIVFLGQL